MAERETPTRRGFRSRFLLGILFLAGLSMLVMPGCGGDSSGPAERKSLRIGLMITPQGLQDQGFNDQAHAGLKLAEQKHKVDAVVIEPATMSDPEASLRFFTAQSFDAIIAVGGAFTRAIRSIAKEKPELPFYVIDVDFDEKNIQGIVFREQEGSFLCGFLASRMSKTGKVGFIGGVKIPVMERFAAGFLQGAKHARADVEVSLNYIATDFSGFNKPDQANILARELYGQGHDVLFPAAGASGLGVIAAAVKLRKFVIGVDQNQDSLAPGLVLTSMLKRVDLVVEDVIRSLSEGKGSAAVKRSYGMADGAIGLTDFQFSSQVLGDDLIKELRELQQAIISGSLQVEGTLPAEP